MLRVVFVMVRLSLMMFLQFFIWGAWYVTAAVYLEKIGFDGNARGWTYSVGPIAGMISPFFVGMIADRFFATERVLGILHLLGAGAMYAATQLMLAGSASPTVINLVFFCHMLCFFPTLALTNSLAMQHMTNSEVQFPLIRVFGTLGWIVAGLVISWQEWDKAMPLPGRELGIEPFQMAAAAAACLGVFSFLLPHTPPPAAGQRITAREVLGLDAFFLLKRRSFLVFMVSSFLICIPLAFYYQLAYKFVTASGLDNPAGKMTLGQMSEVFFMLAMPLFFSFLGVKRMLLVGMLAWVLRYGLFALAAGASGNSAWAESITQYAPFLANGPGAVHWMIILGILLHGICYDFFFVTGQIYTDKCAPRAIRSQAQGMLVLFTLGLGMFIGAKVAGRVEVHYTTGEGANAVVAWPELWTGPMIGAAIVLAFFFLAFKDHVKAQDEQDVTEDGIAEAAALEKLT